MSLIKEYRPDIDGLRAIAVLVVIFYHAHFTGFSGGFTGVDVFFVISGFLITQHLLSEIDKTETITLSKFYSKRVKRLVPTLAVVILSSLILWTIFLVGVKEETRKFVNSITSSVFGLANFYFQKHTGGYFDSSSEEMPLLHFWSLAVEEQFYLVWPLILLITKKVSNIRRFKSNYFRVLSTIVLLSLGASIFLTQTGQIEMAFYMMPFRAWELGLGGLLVFATQVEKPFFENRILKEIIPLLSLLAISIPVFLYDESTIFPGISAILPVLGTVFLIYSGTVNPDNVCSRIIANRWFVKIGLLSYGLYLWHWPFLAMARVWYMGVTPPLSLRVSIIALSFILSQLSITYIDQPIRYGDLLKKWKSYKVIGSGLVCSLLLVAIAHETLRYEKSNTNSVLARMNKLIQEGINRKTCVETQNSVPENKCTVFGSKDGRYDSEIVIWGDSHAGSYFPMLQDFVVNKKLKTSLVYDAGNLSIIPSLRHSAITNDLNKRSLVKPVNLILTNRWPKYVGKETISKTKTTRYLDKEQTISGSIKVFSQYLNNTLTEVQKVGVSKILIILPFPEYHYIPLRCFQRNFDFCKTSREEFEDYRQEVKVAIEEVAKKFNNVRVVDPAVTFCDVNSCPQFMQIDSLPTPVVKDGNHPTAIAVRHLGKKIEKDLKWLAE